MADTILKSSFKHIGMMIDMMIGSFIICCVNQTTTFETLIGDEIKTKTKIQKKKQHWNIVTVVFVVVVAVVVVVVVSIQKINCKFANQKQDQYLMCVCVCAWMLFSIGKILINHS